MATDEIRIQDLEARYSRRERWVLVRTALLSAVPVVMGIVLLWWTLNEVRVAQSNLAVAKEQLAETETVLVATREDLGNTGSQLEAVRRQLTGTEAELEATRAELGTARSELGEAKEQLSRAKETLDKTETELFETRRQLEVALRTSASYRENLYDLDWTELKMIASSSETYKILTYVNDLRQADVGWSARGTRPEEGFNSPTFAAYILQQVDPERFPPGKPAATVLGGLERVAIGARRPGDIVVYDSGYHMFYFRDRDGVDFVVGMTPDGIAALKMAFGPTIRYVLRTPRS
jgi:hypothetical protein